MTNSSTATDPRHNHREVASPTGTDLTCKSWLTEAPFRMLQNNLHKDVAENPHELVVYGGIGRAARTWKDFDTILSSLKDLEEDETLVVQSGKPVGVFKTHSDAPRVLIANSNLVPHWANWDHFNELDKKGLMMYGQTTAGLDIHWYTRYCSRHLRNICRGWKATLRRRSKGTVGINRWTWRYGRCPASGGDDGRRVLPSCGMR